jgi:predicted aspartyl protease
MKFPYTKFAVHEKKTISRPSLWIFFKNGKRFIFTEGIIDSGADYVILPIEMAGELGIKLDIQKKEKFIGAGKNSFNVYSSETKITYTLKQNGFRNYEVETIVYFAESQPSVLLGNYGFLDQFKITLDGIRKEIEITK